MPTRRDFLKSVAALATPPYVLGGRTPTDETAAGQAAVPAFKALDKEIRQFIAEKEVPGAALSIAYKGRLIFARGYGFAEKETSTPCTARSQFRIGSVSKFVTAVCIMKLVESGKLSLSTKAIPFLGIKPYVSPGGRYDNRIDSITVEMLLRHIAGFAKALHFVPNHTQVAEALKIPPDKQTVTDFVRYGLRLPLDSVPGTTWEYNNFDYSVLGLVVERASGLTLDAFLQKEIGSPLGIRDLRIGHTLKKDRYENEVVYYDAYELIDKQLFPSVHPSNPGAKVPWSYGAYLFECGSGAGDMVASMPALCRLMSALVTPGRTPLLTPTSVRAMASPPPGALGHKPDGSPVDHYYGLGLNVDWYPGDVVVAYHGGGLPGSSTWIKTWEQGITAAMSCNTNDKPGVLAMSMIEPVRTRSAEAVKDPGIAGIDLFGRYL